jgi:predicted transcriptional regulator
MQLLRFILVAALCATTIPTALAQQTQGPVLPVHVPNVTLTDFDKRPMSMPDHGSKHMMIFYVDPDAHRQNKEFQAEVEAKEPELYSPHIQAYAIINLKDTIWPNSLVRAIADRRTRGKPSVNMADDNHILRNAWGLGDVNGKFCVLFVTREGELVYFRAGDFTAKDVADFYATVAKYQ